MIYISTFLILLTAIPFIIARELVIPFTITFATNWDKGEITIFVPPQPYDPSLTYIQSTQVSKKEYNLSEVAGHREGSIDGETGPKYRLFGDFQVSQTTSLENEYLLYVRDGTRIQQCTVAVNGEPEDDQVYIKLVGKEEIKSTSNMVVVKC